MITAATSGLLGDIVFGIPAMKKLGVTHLYVKETCFYRKKISLLDKIKPLLEQCGFIVLPTSGEYPPHEYEPNLKFDYDLDAARLEPRRDKNHIIVSYLNCFGLDRRNWNRPFLTVKGDNDIKKPYSLINLTPRWREKSKVDWVDVYRQIEGDVYFIGLREEWEEFEEKYGLLPCIPTKDMLELAILIRDCDTLYCNQSVALALAQGMGKKYYCEFRPSKTNCRMNTQNEGVL
jgi:hypothetical protein